MQKDSEDPRVLHWILVVPVANYFRFRFLDAISICRRLQALQPRSSKTSGRMDTQESRLLFQFPNDLRRPS